MWSLRKAGYLAHGLPAAAASVDAPRTSSDFQLADAAAPSSRPWSLKTRRVLRDGALSVEQGALYGPCGTGAIVWEGQLTARSVGEHHLDSVIQVLT